MKIGDRVAIQVSKTRTIVFGRLAEVVAGEAVVDVGGKRFERALKRVRTERDALLEIIRRRKAKEKSRKKAMRGQ